MPSLESMKFPKWTKIIAFVLVVALVLMGAHYYFNIYLLQNRDTDSDGLTDWDEIHVYETDVNNPDTDDDELSDSKEIEIKTDPTNPDSDADNLLDGQEVRLSTDPNDPNTDNDDFLDAEEIELGINPIIPNPTVSYALEKGWPEAYIKKLKAMDKDGEMNADETVFIDHLIRIPVHNLRLRDRAIDVILADNEVTSIEAEMLPKLIALPYDTFEQFIDFGLNKETSKYLDIIGSYAIMSSPEGKFGEFILKNNLCIQDGKLTDNEVNFLKFPDQYAEKMIEIYLDDLETHNLQLADELKKLPDLNKSQKPDMNAINVEVLEDFIVLAKDKRNGNKFEEMFKIGIPEKRLYCTPLQAAHWRLIDEEPDSSSMNLMGYPVFFTEQAWKYTSTSDNFKSERWKDFDESTYRLNDPMLIGIYNENNFEYKIMNDWGSAKKMFEGKMGDCAYFGTFDSYCLTKNGYGSMGLWTLWKGKGYTGHLSSIFRYSNDSRYYLLEPFDLHGPFNDIDEAAKDVYSRLSSWGGKSGPYQGYKLLSINLKTGKLEPYSGKDF